MIQYFFVPGRMFELCCAEIDSIVLPLNMQRTHSSTDILHYSSELPQDINWIVNLSGGVYKAGKLDLEIKLNEFKDNYAEVIAGYILESRKGIDKVTFGISVYGNSMVGKQSNTFLREIKSLLSDKDVSSAYIENDHGELSSVQVTKRGMTGEKGIEVILSFSDDILYVGQTIAVQNFDLWSEVDYGRPARDPKSGMLPPKVARMMINLGVGAYGEHGNSEMVVYDPFCGSGTVVTEALRLGLKAVGSDNSPKAIADTQKNVDWLLRASYFKNDHYKRAEEVNVFEADASHVDEFLEPNSVDIIVTEPYLGPNFTEAPTPGKLERVIKGLEKLYIGALKSFYPVLKPGGVIIFAEPQYFMERKTYKIGIIDRSEKFGYTLDSKILEYNREKALVGRRIGVLKKK